MAQDLMARFRSKEDIYRYLTQQGKPQFLWSLSSLVGVFLPSMSGTSLDFMRDILKEEKLYLRTNEVIHLEIPNYKEISVKNLYDDAI